MLWVNLVRSLCDIGGVVRHRASFVHIEHIWLFVIFSNEIGFGNIDVFFAATATHFLAFTLRLLDAILFFKNSGNDWASLVKGVGHAACCLSNLFGRQVVVHK